MTERFDQHRFEELILFVVRRCEGDSTFGATKLNKLLFFIDFTAYRKFGYSVTGAEYQKLERGPAPKQLSPTPTLLREPGDLLTITRDYFGKERQRLIASREADLSGFSGQQIALVDEIIERLRDRNASSLSRLSHDFIGWRAAQYGDHIPYETALVQTESLSEADRAAASNLKTLNWNDSNSCPQVPISAPLQ